MTDTRQTPAGEAGESKAHCAFCEMGPMISEMFYGFCSKETQQHFRNARVEVLKGFRSILDARIEHLSRERQKGTTVPVE
jgi:hypothetical protein